MKRILSILLVVAVITSVLAGCTGGTSGASGTTAAATGNAQGNASTTAGTTAAPQSTEPVVFNVGVKQDIQSLDIGNPGTTTNWNFDWMLYDRLVQVEADGTYTPRLWKEWSHNSDGTEWTVTLQEGVKFHNGQPFTSEAMKVSLERIATDTTLSMHSNWNTLTEVEIIDDLHFKLKYKQPNGSVLFFAFVTPYVEPKAFKELGADKYFLNPIGCGLFKFVSWTPGNELVVERFADYWDKSVTTNFDKVVMKVITEDTTRVAALDTGAVDLVDQVPFELYPTVQNIKTAELLELPGSRTYWMGMNCAPGEVFADAKAREAFSLSIDRNLIASSIYGNAAGAKWFVPGNNNGYDKELAESGKYYQYDPEKAKALLAESGYDGRPLRFVLTNQLAKVSELAQALIFMLESTGFKVQLDMIESASLSERRNSGNWDMAAGQFAFTPDSESFANAQIVNDRISSKFNNEALNANFKSATTSVDPAERAGHLRAGYKMAAELCGPIFPMFTISQSFGISKKLTGFSTVSDSIYDWRHLILNK